jgi:hypothetical protein
MQSHALGPTDATIFVVFISIVGGLAAIGIVVAGVVAVTRIATRHRERMARIGMGLNPDGPEPTPDSVSANTSLSSAPAESWNRYSTTDPAAATNRP